MRGGWTGLGRLQGAVALEYGVLELDAGWGSL